MGLHPSKAFDIVVDIDSVQNGGKGWPVLLSEHLHGQVQAVLQGMHLHNSDEPFSGRLSRILGLDSSRQIVSVFGHSRRGKSHIISRLAGVAGISGNSRGLGVLCSNASLGKDYIFLEPGEPGGAGALSEATVMDRKATEQFIDGIALRLAEKVVLVTGELQWQDEELMRALRHQLSDQGSGKTLFVVHNFQSALSQQDVFAAWKRSIRDTFEGSAHTAEVFVPGGDKKSAAAEATTAEATTAEATAFVEDNGTTHFFVCKEGTPAGDMYNEASYALMRLMLGGRTVERKTSVLEEFVAATADVVRDICEDPSTVDLAADFSLLDAPVQAPKSGKKPAEDPWAVPDLTLTPWDIACQQSPIRIQVGGNLALRATSVTVDSTNVFLFESSDAFEPAYDIIDDERGLTVIMDLAGFAADSAAGVRAGTVEAVIDGDDCLVIHGTRNLSYRPYLYDEDGELQCESLAEYPERALKLHPEISPGSEAGSSDGRRCGEFTRTIKFNTKLYFPEIMSFDIANGCAQVFLKKRKRAKGVQASAPQTTWTSAWT